MTEPEEGQFDFTVPRRLIDQARERSMRIVFLWFGSWKNGIMSYCPSWVKLNTERFKRVLSSDGTPVHNLSCNCEENVKADAKAFAALCAILREYDGEENTVNFMHRTTRGNFLLREGYQAARLGTHLGEMVFVLPDEGVSPEVLLQDPAFLGSLDIHGADSFHGKIEWSVPKFDLESQLDLKELLKSMGITDLLDREKADLSALTDLEAWISGASQLARVKVDEEGVEAAAVTILEAAGSALPVWDRL